MWWGGGVEKANRQSHDGENKAGKAETTGQVGRRHFEGCLERALVVGLTSFPDILLGQPGIWLWIVDAVSGGWWRGTRSE
jgi:hypothetical protein